MSRQMATTVCSRKARRADADLGLGEMGLYHSAIADRALLATCAWDLVLRHVDEAVPSAPRTFERHAGETYLVTGHRRHAVERAGLTAFALEIRELIRMGRRHEMVGEGANCLARHYRAADDVPDVRPFDHIAAYQEGALDLRDLGVELRRAAVGLPDRAVGAEPWRRPPEARPTCDLKPPSRAIASHARVRGPRPARRVGRRRRWLARPAGRDRPRTSRHPPASSSTRRCWRRPARCLDDAEKVTGSVSIPFAEQRQQQAEQPRRAGHPEQRRRQSPLLDVVSRGFHRGAQRPRHGRSSGHRQGRRKTGSRYQRALLQPLSYLFAPQAGPRARATPSSLSICSIDLPLVSMPRK